MTCLYVQIVTEPTVKQRTKHGFILEYLKSKSQEHIHSPLRT